MTPNLNKQPVFSVRSLTRRFGRITALSNIDLDVHAGGVIGLVGENGAGKTTLIRHLLGLLKPTSGVVTVFGLDPVEMPQVVLQNIGYVSEERAVPNWMRINELLRYQKSFYPTWDDALVNELIEAFQLNLRNRIRSLSRGQRARVCLVTALAHRPQLLVLDEPSSGLDPVVRRDVLSVVIRTVADEGRTVLFSSHLLDEVQRVADHIVFLNQGRKLLDEPLDQVFSRHRRLVVHFEQPINQLPQGLPGVIGATGNENEWTLLCNGQVEQLTNWVAALRGEIVENSTPSLDEIFVARVETRAEKK